MFFFRDLERRQTKMGIKTSVDCRSRSRHPQPSVSQLVNAYTWGVASRLHPVFFARSVPPPGRVGSGGGSDQPLPLPLLGGGAATRTVRSMLSFLHPRGEPLTLIGYRPDRPSPRSSPRSPPPSCAAVGPGGRLRAIVRTVRHRHQPRFGPDIGGIGTRR